MSVSMSLSLYQSTSDTRDPGIKTDRVLVPGCFLSLFDYRSPGSHGTSPPMLAAVTAQHRRFMGLQEEASRKRAAPAGLGGGRGAERSQIGRPRLEPSPGLHAQATLGWEELVRSKRQIANVAATFAGAAAQEALASADVGRALKDAYSPGYVESWARASLSWRAACKLMGHAPFPVRVSPLLLVLTDRVTRLGLEPGGLGAWLSALRAAVDQGRLGWGLDTLDERWVSMLRRGLTKRFKGQNARGQKAGLGLVLLGRMMDLRPEAGGHTREEQEVLLQMRFAHAGFLRTGEHTGGGKTVRPPLLCQDIEFLLSDALTEEPGRVRFAPSLQDVVGMRVTLRMAKTGHLETPPQVALIGRRSDRFDVVAEIWHHIQGKGGFSTPSLPLFGRTGAVYRRGMAVWLGKIGVDPDPFGGHSTRRGACNDALDDGVPLGDVMKAGRWRSLAWAQYRSLTPAAMRRIAAVRPTVGVHPVSPKMACLWEIKAALKAGSA